MIFFITCLFSSTFLPLIIAFPQINLYRTDWMSDTKHNLILEYDCIDIAATIEYENDPHQILSYCLTEMIFKQTIKDNNIDQKFTFFDLYKENISSEQLYLWSAPIDLIERYEFYLNDLLISKESSSISNDLFYNCTPPRFGLLCEYSFDLILLSNDKSLNEIIYDYYQEEYIPKDLTCYIHLECNRGSKSVCLDWTEICDGFIDCLNDQIDEKHCWQLEINKCEKNEYRCYNGQCISNRFLHDDRHHYECLDKSDEAVGEHNFDSKIGEPIFNPEDIVCSKRYNLPFIKTTSSCAFIRDDIFNEMMLLDKPNSITDNCWLAVKCYYNFDQFQNPMCDEFCIEEECLDIINDDCPSLLIFPAGPLVFSHIYLGFVKTIDGYGKVRMPTYVCYNEKLCNGFPSNKTLLIFNNTTCRRTEDIPMKFSTQSGNSLIVMYIEGFYRELYHCNTIIYDNLTICNNSIMYQCLKSSKCISKYRLCDGNYDCDYKDDEECSLTNGLCSPIESETLFKCTTNNKCISMRKVDDGYCNCIIYDRYGCSDENSNHCLNNHFNLCTRTFRDTYTKTHVSFTTICDGFTELIPMIISGQIYTDETECQYWICNNIYTRCNEIWNCFNGEDEINCNIPSLLECPINYHLCVLPFTYKLTCLSIEKANDGIIDCVGASDEPKLCRRDTYGTHHMLDFYCSDHINPSCIYVNAICHSNNSCMYGTNELLCKTTINEYPYGFCHNQYDQFRTDAGKFICNHFKVREKASMVHFFIDNTNHFNEQIITKYTKTTLIEHFPIIDNEYEYEYNDYFYNRCHRGLPILLHWLNINQNQLKLACLCPPSYYGSECQYQNQRISLTLQFQTYVDSRQIIFSIIILLIDNSNEQIIHSFKQLTYIYTEHCQRKFNIYLTYSTRPKDIEKNYSIRIDIYEKILFGHRGSFIIPINYSFLPVHRIAHLINIPRNNQTINDCYDNQCTHGQCIKYYSDDLNNNYFCRCNQGWTGKFCTIKYKCICSLDSLCIGITSNNRSICICPINKWGPRCLLTNKICQLNKTELCLNEGQCISIENDILSDKKYLCLCPKGFRGEKCEIIDKQLILSFNENIQLPEFLLIHFIEIINGSLPKNGSTYKKIYPYKKSLIIQWSRPFHIVLTEFSNKNYYLIYINKTLNESKTIKKTIESSDHCKHLNELFNETINNFHIIRRIKYYHIPCENSSLNLSCFYDIDHFCFCYYFNGKRLSNCFQFNSSLKYNCFGNKYCENEGKCLQDNINCPQTAACICPECFHGIQCQFISSLFDVSLDAILGYHIEFNISIDKQLPIIQTSIALTTIMIIIGFINGILSILTFKNKQTRQVGCGIYLFGSTITTLLTTFMFTFKFWILILTQIGSIQNLSFLNIQCYLTDFILRLCLYIDKWLNAVVAIERTFNIIKGTNFNRKKSQIIAKYTIIIIIIFNILTTIHDPINRHLLEDNEDNYKRIWCIVSYTNKLQIYNKFIYIFHFFIPFLINIISSIIIIVVSTRRRIIIQSGQTYRKILFEQIEQHAHLLIAPFLLILLSLPRLIISLIFGCMQSINNSWLYLIGYLISHLPPMLIFIVFVLPSKLYKKEVRKTVKQYQQAIQRQIQLINHRWGIE